MNLKAVGRGSRGRRTGEYGRIAVAGVALAFTLGACGSDDAGPEAAGTPASSATSASASNESGHPSSPYGSHPSTAATPGADSASTPAGGARSTATVTIASFAFSPQNPTFKVGQTVTVVNNDSAPHTWTSEEGGFDTGRLQPGQSTTVTLSKAGSFTVICEIHPSMTGTVTVTA